MKTDRLIGILSILLQKEKATAPELAALFEVSRRTILRDIDALSRAGIPLRTTQGVGGGISIMENYRLDRTALTGGDMRAILAGLRSLDSVSGTHRYAQLMEKISPGASRMLQGDERILIDLSSWYGQQLAEKIETVHEAAERRRLLLFHYLSPSGESDREIEPYDLLFQWSNWYVWGYCHLRQDFRLFKLNRITALRAGGEFAPREAPLPDLSNERVFPEKFQVRLRVSAKYKWRLAEEYGPGSFTETEEGDCLFSHGFTDREQALSWALSFQGKAEVLSPEDLREEMHRIGKKIAKRHKNMTDS